MSASQNRRSPPSPQVLSVARPEWVEPWVSERKSAQPEAAALPPDRWAVRLSVPRFPPFPVRAGFQKYPPGHLRQSYPLQVRAVWFVRARSTSHRWRARTFRGWGRSPGPERFGPARAVFPGFPLAHARQFVARIRQVFLQPCGQSPPALSTEKQAVRAGKARCLLW